MIIIDLSRNIIKRYVEVATPEKITSNSETVYGTVVNEGDVLYVQIDGSSILTPVSSTIDIREGDRVLVLVKNHEATVIGSPTSATARLEELRALEEGVSEFEVILADKVGTGELVAMIATIEELRAKDVEISGKLVANEAIVETLTAENATINGKLDVYQADIEELEAKIIDADEIAAKYATIESLNATNADITNLESVHAEFVNATVGRLNAYDASIENLDTKKLSAEQADLKYANIDFSNIGEAAVTKIFSESGIINDLIVSEGKITGELVGVTIKGDLIEGGTVVADKLVVKGEDGLYYKLNSTVDGVTQEQLSTEEYQSALHGDNIIANTITAEKVNVDDLVAFDATIGGFNITEDSLYSGVKSSIDNTTRGIYLDNAGQIAFGDSSNYITYYYDEDEDGWKLVVSAQSIIFGASQKSMEEFVEEVTTLSDRVDDSVASVVRYYILSEEDPSVPTENPPADWSTVEVDGEGSLYYVDCTTYLDGTFSYSEVSKSNAKDAAEAARNVADSAETVSNGLVGRVSTVEVTVDAINRCISNLVTDANGQSLMTQTADGWVFSTGSIDETLNTTSDALTSLRNAVGDWDSSNTISAQIDSLISIVNNHGKSLDWVNIGSYSEGELDQWGGNLLSGKRWLPNIPAVTLTAIANGLNIYGYKQRDNIYAYTDVYLEPGTYVASANATSTIGMGEFGMTVSTDGGMSYSQWSDYYVGIEDDGSLVEFTFNLSVGSYCRFLLFANVNLGTYGTGDASYTNIKLIREGAPDKLPCIELGESDSDYKVLITNKAILFKEGSTAPTKIHDNTLVTNNVEVKSELRQNNWAWSVRSNGNLGLTWKGGVIVG